MRVLGCILAFWIAVTTSAFAQDAPQIEVVFEETETIPGRLLTLRLTVLVPTFMPQPPTWPDLESPNLMVRLPSKASTATSKTVNGETWSGISRRYQITPMVPGRFSIAPSVVKITYQDPEGGAPLQAELPVPEISVVGVLPEGAEGLDPFLAAQELTLSQSLEGEAEDLAAGGSFARELTVKLKGVPPLFVPPLTPEVAPDGLRAYPENPVLEDHDDRGVPSGTRTEKTVYVAEGGVDGVLPAVTLKWYNLKTKTVEEATVPEMPVQADAPAGAGAALVGTAWGAMAVKLAGMGLALGLLGGAIWLSRRRLRTVVAALMARWQASERYAWRHLCAQIQAKDLGAARTAFEGWREKSSGQAAAHDAEVEAVFLALGNGAFGVDSSADQAAIWQDLALRLKDLRRALLRQRRINSPALAALNPVSAAST